MKLFALTLCFLLCLSLSAQIESPFSKGAYFLGLGNSGSATESSQALFYNQAGIAGEKSLSTTVHGARLYDQSGISHLHAGVVLPTDGYGHFGLRVSNFGIDGYSFQNYSLTYARKLFANFNLALSFNAYQFRIENYGNAFLPNVEIGFLTRINDKVNVAAHIANPFPAGLSERRDFPTIFTAGLQYQVSKLVSIQADIEKNIEETQNFKVGIQYQIHPMLGLRAGINTLPGTVYFGLGTRWKNFEIDLGNGFHPILGNSTGISLTYRNVKE